MNKTVKVTPNVFNAIKTLLKGGASYTECANYMGISPSSVGNINRAETYEEYQRIVYESSATHRAKMAAIKANEAAKEAKKEEPAPQIVEHRQTVTVQASHFMLQEQQKTNELLTLISNKLAFIVDELYGTKPKEAKDEA